MENNRPKIASLSLQELAQLLISCFRLLGKKIDMPAEELKEFLQEILKYQGWMYADTFREAFSRYAADQLEGADKLRPSVSPWFVSRLMKLSIKKATAYNAKKNPEVHAGGFSGEQKYMLFLKHINSNKCLPANPDWIAIYEYLGNIQKLTLPTEWDAMPYSHKLKHASQAVTDWTHRSFTITDTLIYKRTNTYEGLGTRLENSHKQRINHGSHHA